MTMLHVPAEKRAEWAARVARVRHDRTFAASEPWDSMPTKWRQVMCTAAADDLAAVLPDVLAYGAAQATTAAELSDAAAQALMGVVPQIDDLESAEVIVRRAMQWEKQAASLRALDGES